MTTTPLLENDRRISLLWELLKSYADTPQNIRVCQHLVNRTETTQKEIILELTTVIADGVFYGNWPWIKVGAK